METREIKLLAYDKKTNSKLKVISLNWNNKEELIGGYFLNNFYEEIVLDIDDVNIVQYTGLKDKNGTEIFEGDILNSSGDILVVGWSNKFASFVLNKKGWAYSHWFGEALNSTDCEVIGNLFQNPELIK